MKLAIVGSRTFDDWELFQIEVDSYREHLSKPVTTIVSGGAKGADRFARRYALLYDLELVEFLPDWDRFGKSAGFRRNRDIVDHCDALMCFFGPQGESRGASNSLHMAQKAGKPWASVYQRSYDD